MPCTTVTREHWQPRQDTKMEKQYIIKFRSTCVHTILKSWEASSSKVGVGCGRLPKKDDSQLIRQCVSKGSDLNILDEWKIEPENPNTIGSSFKPSIRR